MARSRLIAIVEDDEHAREALADLIMSLGYEAATFSSAEEYLESKIFRKTACLLSDLELPGMSGLDMYHRLIATDIHIPTIFVTGHSDEIILVRALKSGAIDVLRKPVTDRQLIECLAKAIPQSRKAQQKSPE
jgi:FixJ family two-component response regulator